MPPNEGSSALVSRGNRDIVDHESTRIRRLGVRPSTSRALVLRDARVGPGEVQLFRKQIFGQEKLDLLAEDMIKSAVRAPFDFLKLRRSIEAQYEAYASQIECLRDPEFSWWSLVSELGARSTSDPTPEQLADLVGSKVHNLYVLAASWRLSTIVMDQLVKLGISSSNINLAIGADKGVTSLMEMLHEALQNVLVLQLSMIRTYSLASEHYGPYFRTSGDGSLEFDRSRLKDIFKSYVDSILLEFILPQSRYPIHVLAALLRDCLDEVPKEAKRITQAMYDCLGDLCVTVQCLDMVESPLVNLAPSQVQASSIMERFKGAQKLSAEASSIANTAKYCNFVHPLPKLKQKSNLDALWAAIDKNYRDVTGVTIDELFELGKERVPKGGWSYVGEAISAGEGPSSRPKKLLNSRPHEGYGSDSDIPNLVTDSDSSDLLDNGYTEESESDEGGYDDDVIDTDDEDNLREMERECMDITSANPELLEAHISDSTSKVKGNAFVKVLRQLTGRVFSGDPVLTVDEKPRSNFHGPERPPQGTTSGAPESKTTVPQVPAGMKEVVEVPDDELLVKKKKKKKKKPKKKKKATSADNLPEGDGDEGEEGEGKAEGEGEGEESTRNPEETGIEKGMDSLSIEAKPAVTQAPKSTPKKAPNSGVAGQASSIYTGGLHLPSSISLVAATAQSARSYLKEENLLGEKTKVKSRPEPSSSKAPNKKSWGSKNKEKGKDKASEEKDSGNILSRLVAGARASTRTCFQKLFGHQKGSMKWNDFLKSMADIGFTFKPVGGSVVEFHPPDPRDHDFTLHRPHPGNEVDPKLIKVIAMRLKGRYNWRPDEFITDG